MDPRRVHHGQVRVQAGAAGRSQRGHEDPVPRRHLVHPGTDRIDHAGPVEAGRVGQLRGEERVGTGPDVGVGGVDPDRVQAHPDLTGPRFRHRQLPVLQDLRSPERRHLDAVHHATPVGGSAPRVSACSSSVLRGGVNMSTSTQEDSRVWAPCGTHGGITATSPGRMVRDSPSMWNSNSPSSTTTICSSSCTWVGATVWGANDTKLAIAFSPSTGRNARPGTNSTGSMSSTLTKRPGPVGTPWAWLLKWASPPLLVILKPTCRRSGRGLRPRTGCQRCARLVGCSAPYPKLVRLR